MSTKIVGALKGALVVSNGKDLFKVDRLGVVSQSNSRGPQRNVLPANHAQSTAIARLR